jgi:hypothetical protein
MTELLRLPSGNFNMTTLDYISLAALVGIALYTIVRLFMTWRRLALIEKRVSPLRRKVARHTLRAFPL